VRAGGGLGIFVRSLRVLIVKPVKQAFTKFLPDKSLSANQIEFAVTIIGHLTRAWRDGSGSALRESVHGPQSPGKQDPLYENSVLVMPLPAVKSWRG
jgi:hypothetical protein